MESKIFSTSILNRIKNLVLLIVTKRSSLSLKKTYISTFLLKITIFPKCQNELTDYQSFNLYLDFWKSRSVQSSNLKKFSGPANQDFCQGLQLENKVGLYYKSEIIQLTN